jgi:RND family efflux transporter MFP subunit
MRSRDGLMSPAGVMMPCKRWNRFGWIQSAWACTLCFLLPALFLVGCGEKPTPGPPPSPKVTVAQPVRRDVTDYLELAGNAKSIRTVQLVARVEGYLQQVLFKDGQLVKEGQLLYVIQQDTYKDRLHQAEGQVAMLQAQVEYAKSQFERYSNLAKHKAASQEDVDNWRYQRDSAQANLMAAEASRDLARLDLSYTQIAAPFDGRIDERLKDPGNLVGSGGSTPLAVMNQVHPIYVYFTVSDLDLARLVESAHGLPGAGDLRDWPVHVGVPGEEAYPHEGRIDFASVSLAPTSGTLLMRGVFSNSADEILPGMYARVRVPLDKKNLYVVPEAAVSTDQEGTYVLIVGENDVVERRGVETGPRTDQMRAIEEGLGGSEWVIVKGLLRAVPGRRVTPEREGAAPPDSASSARN